MYGSYMGVSFRYWLLFFFFLFFGCMVLIWECPVGTGFFFFFFFLFIDLSIFGDIFSGNMGVLADYFIFCLFVLMICMNFPMVLNDIMWLWLLTKWTVLMVDISISY